MGTIQKIKTANIHNTFGLLVEAGITVLPILEKGGISIISDCKTDRKCNFYLKFAPGYFQIRIFNKLHTQILFSVEINCKERTLLLYSTNNFVSIKSQSGTEHYKLVYKNEDQIYQYSCPAAVVDLNNEIHGYTNSIINSYKNSHEASTEYDPLLGLVNVIEGLTKEEVGSTINDLLSSSLSHRVIRNALQELLSQHDLKKLTDELLGELFLILYSVDDYKLSLSQEEGSKFALKSGENDLLEITPDGLSIDFGDYNVYISIEAVDIKIELPDYTLYLYQNSTLESEDFYFKQNGGITGDGLYRELVDSLTLYFESQTDVKYTRIDAGNAVQNFLKSDAFNKLINYIAQKIWESKLQESGISLDEFTAFIQSKLRLCPYAASRINVIQQV